MPRVVTNQTADRQSARKAEILEVAGRLFEDLGYEKTTLEMIGREVGLSKQSLYYYVASKEAALLEVCRARSEETPEQRLQRLLDESEQPDAVLADYIQHVISHYMKDPRTGLLARHLHSMSEEVQSEVREDLRQERRMLEQVIQLGQAQALFGEVAPPVAARALQSAVHGVSTWYGEGLSRRAADIIAQYQSLLLGGLRSPAELTQDLFTLFDS